MRLGSINKHTREDFKNRARKLFLAGRSATEVAKCLGISPVTAYRFKKELGLVKRGKVNFEIEIEGLPKTPNELLGRHWRTRAAHAKKWMKLVAAHANQFKPPYPLTSAALSLTRMSSVQPDHDGLSGSFKAVIDALVKLEILADDTPTVIGKPDYRWEKAPPKKGKIKIKVEEM